MNTHVCRLLCFAVEEGRTCGVAHNTASFDDSENIHINKKL